MIGLSRRDIPIFLSMCQMYAREKYAGSIAGAAWGVIHPVLMLSIYTVVFGFVFGMRLPGTDSSFDYVTWLLVGLVPFLAIAEALGGTASSVIRAEALVKNVLFKSELLPIAAACVSLIPLFVGLIFLLGLIEIGGNGLSWHLIYLVPVVSVHLLAITGIGLFLSATAVFVRDIVQALPTLTTLMLFCTPIFYDMQMLPGLAQSVMRWNPLYQLLEAYRAILFHQQAPDFAVLGLLALVSFVLLAGGVLYFRRLRSYFELAL